METAGRASRARPAPLSRRMLCIAASMTCAGVVAGAGRLDVRRIAPAASVSAALIVGRAACADRTWLLTEGNRLIEIDGANASVGTREIGGLGRGDRVWGLACLSDGGLWTMASPRSVARIDRTGRVQERVPVQLPRIELFAAGDRLLFQQLPTAPGVEVLATSPPRQSSTIRPWPGLIGRRATTREDQLTRNLVKCGLGLGDEVPCWFANEAAISVSSGRSARTIAVGWLRAGAIDRQTPIWDAALVPSGGFWVLANETASRDRRAGTRLFLASERNGGRLSVDLKPAARLIVAASGTRCVLLLTDGSLIEVGVAS